MRRGFVQRIRYFVRHATTRHQTEIPAAEPGDDRGSLQSVPQGEAKTATVPGSVGTKSKATLAKGRTSAAQQKRPRKQAQVVFQHSTKAQTCACATPFVEKTEDGPHCVKCGKDVVQTF